MRSQPKTMQQSATYPPLKDRPQWILSQCEWRFSDWRINLNKDQPRNLLSYVTHLLCSRPVKQRISEIRWGMVSPEFTTKRSLKQITTRNKEEMEVPRLDRDKIARLNGSSIEHFMLMIISILIVTRTIHFALKGRKILETWRCSNVDIIYENWHLSQAGNHQ